MYPPPTLPLVVTGLVLYVFAICAADVPMVFMDREHQRKYAAFLVFCYLMGFFMMFVPLFFRAR